MKADLSGSIWSVAPVSATNKEVRVEDGPWCAFTRDPEVGLANKERTVFGR